MGGLAAGALVAAEPAAAEERSWNFLTTGNGHGFQVFDANKNRVTQFLEHPYRYLRPRSDPKSDGVGRRNLAFDVFFGLKGSGGAGWLSEPQSAGVPEYVEQANIIRAPATLAGVQAESFFFSPFGIEKNVLVGLVHAPGASHGFALLNFHLGTPDGSGTAPDANGESTRAGAAPKSVVETGPGGGAMVYVPLGGLDRADCEGAFNKVKGGSEIGTKVDCSGNDISVGLEKSLDKEGWFGFAAAFAENAGDADALSTDITNWAGARTPRQILDDTKAEWNAWRKPPPDGALCSDDETKVWRTGEAVLRMGQVREPNITGRKNHGMVLASLPPGEWHSGWVRDGVFSVAAYARSGHHAEAKDALDFFLNAEPVGKFKSYVRNQDYRISVVRYFGTGEEEADYSGQPTPNVEIDGWGMVLYAARQYVEASGDTAWLDSATRAGTVWEALSNGIAAPLEANLESNGIVAADSGIWEVHDANKRHFAFTTLSAARGFCDMAGLAKKANRTSDVAKYQALAKKVRDAFLSSFVDPQGAFAGSTEGLSSGKYIDGAVAEAFTWNVLQDWKGDNAKATLDLLGRLRVDSGGYKRNNDGLSSYDDNEWILVDLRIANALRRAGKTAEADGVVAHVVQKAAANFYLLPELYNAVPTDGQIGKYTGSIPMVGYGGGAFILTMLDRFGLIEPNDCGDGKGMTLPKVDCSTVSTKAPDGPGGQGPNGSNDPSANGGVPDANEVPFAPACLCRLGPARSVPPLVLGGLGAIPIALVLRRRLRRSLGRRE
jgi:GH15 family glucan-1,4-alpha-glucosidase